METVSNIGLMPILRGMATLFFGIVGCFICGMLGSMVYTGAGAIIGALIGMGLFACIGAILSGFLWDVRDSVRKNGTGLHVPSVVSKVMGNHGDMSFVLTVHRVQGIRSNGRVFTKPSLFVTVQCGKYPPKSTCVRNDGVFDEEFRIDVRGEDESMLLRVMDQDFLGETLLGVAPIKIQEEIVDAGFPVEARFPVTLGHAGDMKGDGAEIVLSFAQDLEDPQQRRDLILQTQAMSTAKHYGSINVPDLNTKGGYLEPARVNGRQSLLSSVA